MRLAKNMSASICDEIRERICTLRYLGRSVLREAELAKEFGVSRTPIRQVLQRLEFEGFVKAKHGVGTIVTEYDFGSVHEVHELRLKLAEMIAELSPISCSDTHRASLDELLGRARMLKLNKDPLELWRINFERHKVILDLIGNSALRQTYDYYFLVAVRSWFEIVNQTWDGQVEALCVELDDLTQAIRLGDSASVAFVVRNHLSFHTSQIRQFAIN